ncbi:MAG TPA: glycosyltransferase [Puia sp.]|nr:glycosyltransferase [Puia sp.]
MKVVYVGPYGEGSTSKMRGERLRALLAPASFQVIDLDRPLGEHSRLIRSLGWRFHRGPLVRSVNRFIRQQATGEYDLLWVDKGIFIVPETIDAIRTRKRVHYTPDTAIVFNRSRHFFSSIPLYDFCITTKSFEMEGYRAKGARKVLFCTQGYDPDIHRPSTPFGQKEGAVFVGLWEEAKERYLALLLEAKIKVTLAGVQWERFVHRYRNNPLLNYRGTGVFGDAYARLLSGARVGLGLLSKRFPELHTTRTIEIPACGTAMAGERNSDTLNIFSEGQALLFSDAKEMLEKVQRVIRDDDYCRQVTEAGYRRITGGAFDYTAILRNLLRQMEIRNER